MDNLNKALNKPIFDSSFTKYINDTKSKLGGDVDMRKQGNREALGKSLVDEIRK